jgi:lipoprotein-anchoring transpeptidase ErfK/SrfK
MKRHPTALSRSVRLTALLGAAVLVLALVAGVAAAAAPAQLSAAASPVTVVAGSPAIIAGTLTGDAGGVGGASIDLVQRPAGKAAEWLPAGSTTTAADGAFSFRVAPSVSTDYQVRYAGGVDAAAAQADVRLPVQPLVTLSSPQSLWLGESVRLRGAVAPEHPGAAVAIERRVSGVWQPFLTVALDSSSRFSLPWQPAEFGYYRLRARMAADADHDPGFSASRRVIVNRPNVHDVPMQYDHYIVIVRHEYRLYYYENGILVRGFDVALGKPGYRTPLGLFRIYGKRKPAGGALGACAMFYRQKGGIAIHGTNQPSLIRRPAPRAYSHGCARMLNRHVLWLYARVPVGTRVHNLR